MRLIGFYDRYFAECCVWCRVERVTFWCSELCHRKGSRRFYISVVFVIRTWGLEKGVQALSRCMSCEVPLQCVTEFGIPPLESEVKYTVQL